VARHKRGVLGIRLVSMRLLNITSSNVSLFSLLSPPGRAGSWALDWMRKKALDRRRSVGGYTY